MVILCTTGALRSKVWRCLTIPSDILNYLYWKYHYLSRRREIYDDTLGNDHILCRWPSRGGGIVEDLTKAEMKIRGVVQVINLRQCVSKF